MVLKQSCDERTVALLNDLLRQTSQVTAPDSQRQLKSANDKFIKEVQEVGNMHKTSKLTFNAVRTEPSSNSSTEGGSVAGGLVLIGFQGATLICFNSSEKPKKMRDNHRKHFSSFLTTQRASVGSPSTTGSADLETPL